MRNRVWFWVLAAIFLVAAVIDALDGDVPKLVSSVALLLAFISLALANNQPNRKVFRFAAYLFLVVAMASFLYRLLRWYQIF